MLTNTAPTGAYRGAGRPEAIYIIERLMDAAAREMGLDPAELRRRNMIGPGRCPTRTRWAQTYDSGEFEQILDQGLPLADWHGFAARRAATEARGRLRGRGIATFLEWTGGNALEENVRVDVTADGYIELTSATMAMGQGIATSYAQLALDVFGVPIERIRVLQGDTDRANGFGSAGSRSLFTGGAAVQRGRRSARWTKAGSSRPTALEAAAADIEYRAGRFSGGRHRPRHRPVRARRAAAGAALRRQRRGDGRRAELAERLPHLRGRDRPRHRRGRGRGLRAVNDIGRIVSPIIVRGQIEGGAVQGIGQALCERVAYDASDASCCRPASWTMRCRAPTASAASRPRSTNRSPA